MCSILLNLSNEDEIILPAFAFVSCALPFELRGTKIIFADSCNTHPNIDADRIEELITEKTKALLIIHYAGVACEMDKITSLCKKYNLYLIEDAAHSIDSYYKNMLIGTFGNLSVFSFHETKNISCGEGGMLVCNDLTLYPRAEILRDKGTNRSAFLDKKVDKYTWVDVGSSYVLSDILSAILLSQLELLKAIQEKRINIWSMYREKLEILENKGFCELPFIPVYATNNAHIFYILCKSQDERIALIDYLKSFGIEVSFHYQSLHKSPYYLPKHDGRTLPNAEKFSERLLRLPLYPDLELNEVETIANHIINFYRELDENCAN
jgi:dTDP-4-amino-4,6-dideoxygalactose transaminase